MERAHPDGIRTLFAYQLGKPLFHFICSFVRKRDGTYCVGWKGMMENEVCNARS